jgi:hypothetical protein
MFVIYFVHPANYPFPFGDLIFYFAACAVVEVEVIPAVAFRHPDDFFAVIHVVPIFFAGITEKCFGFFVNDGARTSAFGIHFDDAVNLMPALVVFKSEAAAVLPPRRPGKRERIGEE